MIALFRGLWIVNALSPIERLCIQLFLTHGHAFGLFVYQPVANVPPGCADAVQRFDLEAWLVPTESYYPVPCREFAVLLRPSRRDYVAAKTAGATFLHLWNEMLRSASYNKACRPPAGSYLRELFDRRVLARIRDRRDRRSHAAGDA